MIDRLDIIIGIENCTTCGQKIKGFREWLETLTNQQLTEEYFRQTGIFVRPISSNQFIQF